ncbi:DUF2771 domain-containing protein [Streptomyces sp. JJ36]|uniref:DUF2771 domain-containing protein n=1 Tax=Streptomyces sp. JJ36 TaxID=2736645 RepID=UPI001F40D7FB|nr:DUF2771 domain-containing protein [Streptomyces sp. JJ36]MCF6523065.1 DUF2771 domain-containing protein [Streptomyces sp. JJ36]
MTYAIPGRRRGLRAASAVGAVSLGLLALSACEKPTPLTTVTVGDTTVTTEAACYEDGDKLAQKKFGKCLEKKAEESITVEAGEKIRFGVEPAMAETGWMLFVNGQPVLPEPVDQTYRSFPGDAFFQQQGGAGGGEPQKTQVSVVETKDGDVYGVWHLRIERAG